MSTWQFLWRLVKFSPWRTVGSYLLSAGGWLLVLVPGLISREFFNVLAGKGKWGFGVWGVIAVLLMSGFGYIVTYFGNTIVNVVFSYRTAALLRKNIFERILHRPGARAMPGSSGEA